MFLLFAKLIYAKSGRIIDGESTRLNNILSRFHLENAENLWEDFTHTDFGKIILPFVYLA